MNIKQKGEKIITSQPKKIKVTSNKRGLNLNIPYESRTKYKREFNLNTLNENKTNTT